ncbi:MAG: M48 family metallopeptidase, partial [Pseudomonadales bacterium]|nr:M48 family metallopeptidase [Pseudomonadales bacterium]
HFPFMGTTLKLQAHEGLSESCIENDVLFLKLKPGDQPSQLKPAFENWLKQEARRYIPAFAEQKAQQLGISDKIASFRFSKTKSKWGSCSPDGKLQFNWLIMLSPLEVIHYLVCHEVCHLLQMNHSPAFWQLLGSIHPDYKTSKSWLKQNGHRLWID